MDVVVEGVLVAVVVVVGVFVEVVVVVVRVLIKVVEGVLIPPAMFPSLSGLCSSTSHDTLPVCSVDYSSVGVGVGVRVLDSNEGLAVSWVLVVVEPCKHSFQMNILLFLKTCVISIGIATISRIPCVVVVESSKKTITPSNEVRNIFLLVLGQLLRRDDRGPASGGQEEAGEEGRESLLDLLENLGRKGRGELLELLLETAGL